ncbi:hypothetical protein JCM10449v2_000602 [Rhodotorula kratochvilovae]
MVISSLLGWTTVGVAIAAFIPLIMMNAVQRRNGTSPWFLGVWLLGDAVNVAGLILLGAQPTQIVLAIWYCFADLALTIELVFFGHSDWGARDPQRVKDLIRRIQRHETPWWFRLTTHFRNYTFWDDLVLTTTPDTFKVKIPTEWDTRSFALGIAASLIFSFARIPEFISGERRSKRNEKPEHSVDDPLWWLLIIENFFNLGSIFALSSKTEYFKVESPWIIGSVMSIMFDGILLWRVTVWRGRFFKAGNPEWEAIKAVEEQRDHKRKTLTEEKEELEEEWVLEDIVRDANKKEKKVDENAGYFDRRRAKKHNETVKKLKGEYLKHQSTPEIQGLHDRINKRSATAAHQDAAVRHYDEHLRKHGHEKPDHMALPMGGSDPGDASDSTVSDHAGEMTQLNRRRENPIVQHYHPRLGLSRSRPGSRAQGRDAAEDS